MDLFLISANRENFPDPVYPLGAAYVADAARRAGHHVRTRDLMWEKDPPLALLEDIRRHPPDAIALSFRNLDNAAWPLTRNYLPSYRLLVQNIRKALPSREIPLILGGSAFSLLPDLLLEELDGDYGISGEGERSFPLLLDTLEQGGSLNGIPGLVQKKGSGGSTLINPPHFRSHPSDRIRADPPDRSLFDLSRYARSGGMANIQTKRGCPFHCKYCTYPLLEGDTFRLRESQDVVDEIERLVTKDRIRSFFIVDSIFNAPPDHAHRVSEEILRRKLKIRWSCYVTPSGLTRDLLEVMKRAGCDGIELGTDSAEQGAMIGLGKSFSVSHLKDTARWCNALSLPVCHTLLFGGPGETLQSVRETLKTVEDTRPTAVVAMAGIRVYPDTPLAALAESRGLVKNRRDYLDPVFYIEPGLEEELPGTLLSFAMPRGNWILPGISLPCKPITQKLIRRVGYKKPLWHLLRHAPFKDRVYRDR
ncbi:lipid biosynthesis B12-binding/radical SAM protein [Leptospirillum ferriphilum]|jgi:radical SAM superfamily enzyme YgiQ (UPF0313 family)|uniref:Fe-S oxidoreductase n=1 Tax=Leptospirillum ferriphilum (strain ML-04) TaxID=1048260 RepID=J9ZAZ1_LEPFM|nr:lipid biosynthesis B12-binding/radical SAM protein [Leptospirillum ferriphilum]AFS53705.1 Fe-S oxidoreductase [Leptospirillum ferriphilum ML-04]OOH76183.1 B12-binding domain-containing radical SAM protein [Leptospirillum ferriphilum]